ncbi:MAG: cytochrome c peroxidase, partial [Alphaproteobacteria bacterium]|nr:cytochrome c peroxidase [Alphaproteobacteria bacterium]
MRNPLRTPSGRALVAGLALAIFATGGQVAWAADFGPVEAIKADAKKAALGKRLFFDKRLSGDSSMSCSTCHIP